MQIVTEMKSVYNKDGTETITLTFSTKISNSMRGARISKKFQIRDNPNWKVTTLADWNRYMGGCEIVPLSYSLFNDGWNYA